MIITPWETDNALFELIQTGNILLYENIRLENLVRSAGDELEIKNIIHRQVPFMPLAVLYDAVAIKEHYDKGVDPVYPFAYHGLINGGE